MDERWPVKLCSTTRPRESEEIKVARSALAGDSRKAQAATVVTCASAATPATQCCDGPHMCLQVG